MSTILVRKSNEKIKRKRVQRQSTLPNPIAMTFLFIASIYFLLPFYVVLVASTKTGRGVLETYGLWFSRPFFLFVNLRLVFLIDNAIFVRWLLNSLIYAGSSACISALFSALAGYALAKYIFPGRTLIFNLILGAVLVPSTVLVLPLYLLMSSLGLVNTYWAIILPSLASPFGVYLSRIYIATAVPDDLLDASRIDGANELYIFVKIVGRLIVPVLATIFLFQFAAVWNNYFLSLVMLNDSNLFPLSVGLNLWNSQFAGEQAIIATATLLSALPLILGCIFLQRFVVGGLIRGSQ